VRRRGRATCHSPRHIVNRKTGPMISFKLAGPVSLAAASPMQEVFVGADAFRHDHCTSGFVMMATKWLDELSDPDDETTKHCLSPCRRAACREVLAVVKSAARKRMASASGPAGAFRGGPRS
jgi:hypothetical protein